MSLDFNLLEKVDNNEIDQNIFQALHQEIEYVLQVINLQKYKHLNLF